MEEMRLIRKLKKILECEYGQSNCSILAERLVEKGITELTEELRSKIQYLQSICETVLLNDFWSGYLITDIDEVELKERYAQVVLYTGKEKCDVSDLVLSCENVNAFADYLRNLGFCEEQISASLKELINIGSFAKSLEETKNTVNLLKCFDLTDADRNKFICENFGLLFNDYSRNLDKLFSEICEKYGTAEGFRYLCQNPLIIRIGI
ncbi:MAG: hypothetical protein KBT46_07805 [Ruminococcus sp.]|nr:hypothetical protein [Candidatus Copronaster equi]